MVLVKWAAPVKVGRPSLEYEKPIRRASLRSPNAPKFKEVKCTFYPTFCKWDGKVPLHVVKSPNRGQELINIKKATSNDAIRAALSHLPDDIPLKAFNIKIHYHNNCLRDAHRTCKVSNFEFSEDAVEELCNFEILMHLQSYICNEQFRTDMPSLNSKYLDIRRERGANEVPEKQQKNLKALI